MQFVNVQEMETNSLFGHIGLSRCSAIKAIWYHVQLAHYKICHTEKHHNPIIPDQQHRLVISKLQAKVTVLYGREPSITEMLLLLDMLALPLSA